MAHYLLSVVHRYVGNVVVSYVVGLIVVDLDGGVVLSVGSFRALVSRIGGRGHGVPMPILVDDPSGVAVAIHGSVVGSSEHDGLVLFGPT